VKIVTAKPSAEAIKESPYASERRAIRNNVRDQKGWLVLSRRAVQNLGVFLDDIAWPDGSTSFEGTDTGGWQITGPPPGSGANANNWAITDAGGFPVGASITTPKSILMGYGFETISTAEQRKAVMERIASYLLR
jgi:hypothetical protein